jgi:glycosyltransferase involved in cell wall biosynthesis
VYRRGARIIALSQAFADILERHYRVDPTIIRIVPGGVDLSRFATPESRAQARERLGWPLDRPVIATVGRLIPTKGIEQLIEAAAMIRAEVPDLFVGIAGTGPLAGDLQRLVHERGLDEVVKFVGYISDEQLPLFYRAADAFVVPTQALEGFGLVVVEALACGTPALVTPVGGLPEVVRDLDPGLVLAGTSAANIARGITDALLGRVPLPSEKACIDYTQSFAWQNIAARVHAIYGEVA